MLDLRSSIKDAYPAICFTQRMVSHYPLAFNRSPAMLKLSPLRWLYLRFGIRVNIPPQ